MARDAEEIRAAQRLRYQVFVEELGGDGDRVDHHARLEQDRFDPFCDHLLLIDHSVETVVGVYRLMQREQAEAAGAFYSASEYDLGPILKSDVKVLELGRACLHPGYRGGTAMYQLWAGLAEFVAVNGISIVFGVASFHGSDPQDFAEALSLLYHRHSAPEELRIRVRDEHYQSMNLMPEDQIDRRRAMLETPALIKAYLRMGGSVGDGAYIDRDFNTIDVSLVMDTKMLNARTHSIYTKSR